MGWGERFAQHGAVTTDRVVGPGQAVVVVRPEGCFQFSRLSLAVCTDRWKKVELAGSFSFSCYSSYSPLPRSITWDSGFAGVVGLALCRSIWHGSTALGEFGGSILGIALF